MFQKVTQQATYTNKTSQSFTQAVSKDKRTICNSRTKITNCLNSFRVHTSTVLENLHPCENAVSSCCLMQTREIRTCVQQMGFFAMAASIYFLIKSYAIQHWHHSVSSARKCPQNTAFFPPQCAQVLSVKKKNPTFGILSSSSMSLLSQANQNQDGAGLMISTQSALVEEKLTSAVCSHEIWYVL